MPTYQRLRNFPSVLTFDDIRGWEDGTIFSSKEKAAVEEKLKDQPAGFYPSHTFQPPLKNYYGVSKHTDGQCYVIRERPVGEGQRGMVYLGQRISDNTWVAIKEISEKKETKENILKESQTLGELKQLTGVPLIYEKDGVTVHQLPLEYINGINLLDYLSRSPPLCAREIYNLAINIVKVIDICHKGRRIHRDIKLANFMCNPATGEVILVDYGETIDEKKAINIPRGGGTKGYEAPEVNPDHPDNQNKESYTYSTQTDIYSLGKVLEQLFGFIALIETEDSTYKHRNKYVQNIISNSLQQKLKKMTDAMISEDPNKRPSTEAVMDFLRYECNCLLPIAWSVAGIISAEDCLCLVQEEEEEADDIFTALQSINEVVLTANKKVSLVNLNKIKKKLEKKGIRVRDKAFNISSDSDIDELPDLIKEEWHEKEEENRSTKTIHSFCYFHWPEKKPSINKESMQLIEITDTFTLENYREQIANDATKVTAEDVEKVYGLLKNESSRLHIRFHGKDKILGKRLKKIHKEMTFLDGNTHVTYGQLFQRLETLQSKMEPTKPWLTYICFHLFGHQRTSQGAANIGKQMNDIYQENPKRAKQVLG